MKKLIVKCILSLMFFCLSYDIIAQDLTSGLVSVWELNETSGTIVMDALVSNNGTNYGAAINQTGIIGQSYDFNGVNNYVEVPTIQI